METTVDAIWAIDESSYCNEAMLVLRPAHRQERAISTRASARQPCIPAPRKEASRALADAVLSYRTRSVFGVEGVLRKQYSEVVTFTSKL